jgi:hypothetical protein
MWRSKAVIVCFMFQLIVARAEIVSVEAQEKIILLKLGITLKTKAKTL